MKLAWMTDIHLNFLEKTERLRFYQGMSKVICDAYVISGDIAEADSVCPLLEEMQEIVFKPIYFVAGNHDYYKSDIATVKNNLTHLTQNPKHLYWLPALGPHRLEHDIFITGQDGWADGRIGDYNQSPVEMTDSYIISDLQQEKAVSRERLLLKMQALADIDAAQSERDLNKAIKEGAKKILYVTHIPPFKECCLYFGAYSSEALLPFITCKATGDVLLRTAQANPDIEFLVLCGHIHHESVFQPLDNLTVKAGKAKYRFPGLQEVVKV